MSDDRGRKPAPPINDENDDEPLGLPDPSRPPITEPVQEDPGEKHKRKIEWSRLTFSYNLIGWCIFLLVALTVWDHWWSPGKDAPPLTPLTDTLKLLSTTALGFALAKKSDE